MVACCTPWNNRLFEPPKKGEVLVALFRSVPSQCHVAKGCIGSGGAARSLIPWELWVNIQHPVGMLCIRQQNDLNNKRSKRDSTFQMFVFSICFFQTSENHVYHIYIYICTVHIFYIHQNNLAFWCKCSELQLLGKRRTKVSSATNPCTGNITFQRGVEHLGISRSIGEILCPMINSIHKYIYIYHLHIFTYHFNI